MEDGISIFQVPFTTKAVITIFQCKRVVLPYIFIRYIFPRMKKIFPGELKVYLIQHTGGFKRTIETRLETDKIPNSKLKLVQKWTKEGRYKGATIMLIKGVEIAVKEKADFHLWLEDDALIFDKDCNKWPELMKGKYIGDYEKNDIVRVAYLLTTKTFDKKLLPLLKTNMNKFQKHKDNYDSLKNLEPWKIESRLAIEGGNKRVLLNKNYAARAHQFSKKLRWDGEHKIIKMIKKVAPKEKKIFDIDFGYIKWPYSIKGFYLVDIILFLKRVFYFINRKIGLFGLHIKRKNPKLYYLLKKITPF